MNMRDFDECFQPQEDVEHDDAELPAGQNNRSDKKL